MQVFIFAIVLLAALQASAQNLTELLKNIQPSQNATLKHIIVFKDKPTQDLVNLVGEKIEQFVDSFHFTSGNFSQQILDVLNKTGLVDYIEPDYRVKVFASTNVSLSTQSNPGWGLDRIDQRTLPLDSKYRYPTSGGAGVTVYMIDTGVDISNPEFEGRATFGINSLNVNNAIKIDDNGHGTFGAGIVAGKTYGVAKKAHIVAVKCLGGDGSALVSDVLRGLNWVVQQHMKSDNKNLSLGSPYSRATNTAVANAVSQGISVVVAAGNGDENGIAENSCDFSPSSSSSVITVGASDQQDRVGTFSNYGKCVTIIAPGVKVTSIGDGGGESARTTPISGFGPASGTSFAAPYVTGVIALMLGEAGVVSPSEVKNRLIDSATKNSLTRTNTSPNLLLNSYEVPLTPGSSAARPKCGLSLLVVALSALVLAIM